MGFETSVIYSILIGTVMMLVLVMILITFVVLYSKKIESKNTTIKLALKNKEIELLRTVIETQESEREIIAANFHDEIGPVLTTHKLNLSLLIHDLNDGVLTPEKIKEQQHFVDGIVENIRSVSYELAPPILSNFGLEKALLNFFNTIKKPKVDAQIELGDFEIPKLNALNIYRIILELVNNALKHDKPTLMSANATVVDTVLELQINHNGKGLSNDDFKELTRNSNGIGLNSIQSRMSILQGELHFIQKNDGAQIHVLIPLIVNED